MKEIKITFAELLEGYWDELSVKFFLRLHGMDTNEVMVKDIDYKGKAVVYRQPETEDDYKTLGIF